MMLEPSSDDAHFGQGHYFTDISHMDTQMGKRGQLAFALFRSSNYWGRVTHYLEINVSDLEVERVERVYSYTFGPNKSQYLHRTIALESLPLNGRLISHGETPFAQTNR